MRDIDILKGRKWKNLLHKKNLRLIAAVLLIIIVAIADRLGLGGRAPDGVPKDAVSGRVNVIDGDSLKIGRHEIRLEGIDAPEGPQNCTRNGRQWPCGRRSAAHLRSLAGRAVVTCNTSKRDRFNRLLATCFRKDRNLNRQMVLDGWALSYGKYRREEKQARAAKRGIWVGTFERPRYWRRRNGR